MKKKLLLLLAIVALASSSSYAWTTHYYHSNYNNGTGSRMKIITYSMDRSNIWVTLHAYRGIAPTAEEACYASVGCYPYFYESVYAQYKGNNNYLTRHITDIGAQYWTLEIYLYSVEIGDYTSAKIGW